MANMEDAGTALRCGPAYVLFDLGNPCSWIARSVTDRGDLQRLGLRG
ncbi:hypothetical protein RRSWK_05301 [Rhodopirellula sp. SWK7]|nr:hypothetical protein RRSWK_05301 [Rhodopirellula sp. SWK7]